MRCALQSAALCLSEREDDAPPPLVETAPWGYVRLRLEHYSDDDLRSWAERLLATSWNDVFVYFMHAADRAALCVDAAKAYMRCRRLGAKNAQLFAIANLNMATKKTVNRCCPNREKI